MYEQGVSEPSLCVVREALSYRESIAEASFPEKRLAHYSLLSTEHL